MKFIAVHTICVYDDLMNYEWDSHKNQSNVEKHGISFENATLVFLDLNARIITDTRFDYQEERFIILGEIVNRVHVVAYCERGNGVIRVISARKANKREQRIYANR